GHLTAAPGPNPPAQRRAAVTIQHHRPARVPAVIEGEVVKTSPSRQARRKVVHLVTTLRESDERPAVAVRSTAGAIVLTAAGLGSWCKRAYDAGTMGTYRRQIRAAEAVGDREALGEWLDRKERAVEQRHR